MSNDVLHATAAVATIIGTVVAVMAYTKSNDAAPKPSPPIVQKQYITNQYVQGGAASAIRNPMPRESFSHGGGRSGGMGHSPQTQSDNRPATPRLKAGGLKSGAPPSHSKSVLDDLPSENPPAPKNKPSKSALDDLPSDNPPAQDPGTSHSALNDLDP